MTNEKLNKVFEEAVQFVNNYTEPLPADFLLNLYAYYKKATQNNEPPGSKKPIINAFKANALFQVRDLTEKQAKIGYIKLVNQYFTTNFGDNL
ncbi:acyl-CoA-binding protein [Abyssalbus ytuae]|uniref:Acyl-CoA-binding protein n=1 Tax=Abyssalbus ytuae TaxID=2926907 RepID=A0A9E6ZUI6_9FLAO|nr:acyl-CoA-binding protein [Abyssalbus ytuae]UOB16996.1 acyl-CoA-binding protein [Abyssalbus ytuae]